MKCRKQMSTNKCEFGITNKEYTLNQWYCLIIHAYGISLSGKTNLPSFATILYKINKRPTFFLSLHGSLFEKKIL